MVVARLTLGGKRKEAFECQFELKENLGICKLYSRENFDFNTGVALVETHLYNLFLFRLKLFFFREIPTC